MFTKGVQNTTDNAAEFDDLIGLNGTEAKAKAEAKKTGEVDALLERNGVSREAVSSQQSAVSSTDPNDPMAVLQSANNKEIRIASSCPSCGREETDGTWYSPCPSEDCPSHWEEKGIKHPDFSDDPMVVLQEAQNGNGSASHTYASDTSHFKTPSVGEIVAGVEPGPDWLEKLGEDFKNAHNNAEALTETDLPEYPAEFVRELVKDTNNITKREVMSILGEFQMNLNLGDVAAQADAIVVTDSSQTALMKDARELRLSLRRERLRIENMRVTVKEPYLRRTQVIDGIGRIIRDLFKEKEQHLQNQEDFEKNERARIAAELQAVRVGDLAQFEFIPSLESLQSNEYGYMTDPEWSAFRGQVESDYNGRKAEEAARALLKQMEDERLEKENAALKEKLAATEAEREAANKRLNTRVIRLVDLGMRLDGERYSFEDVRLDVVQVETQPDDEYARTLALIEHRIADIKHKQELKQQAEEKKADRFREMRSIGLTPFALEKRCAFDPVSTALNVSELPVIEITESQINDSNDFDWKDLIEKTAGKIRRVKDEIAAAEEEAERVRQAALATDEEKIRLYTQAVWEVATKQPEVADGQIKLLLNAYYDTVGNATNKLGADVNALIKTSR